MRYSSRRSQVRHCTITGDRVTAERVIEGKDDVFTLPDPNNREVYGRGWRYFAEGRLKIPDSLVQIRFDANLGRVDDDVRFIFSTRFDIGGLLAIQTF